MREQKRSATAAFTGKIQPHAAAPEPQRVLDNLGISRTVARRSLRIFGPVLELEDLTQEATLALLRADQHFDVQRGVAFSTYAYRCCWRACAAILRPLLRERMGLPRAPVKVEESCASELPSPAEGLIRSELWVVGRRVLSDSERDVLRGRFCQGLTLREVGRRRGFGPERARQIEMKALSKLARAMGATRYGTEHIIAL